MEDIELQLNEMKTRLLSVAKESMLHSSTIRPPSPEAARQQQPNQEDTESDTESSDYTSSSEYTSTSDSDDSSSEESSDEEMQMKKPLTPKRPVVAKNIGGSPNSPGMAGFNQLRKMTRYPRLFRKKIVNLDTIKEIAEEAVYDVVSSMFRGVSTMR